MLAVSRRAAGHRRHLLLLVLLLLVLLLLPPPRLRVAPAAADAAVHEQQAGAHGGERQADGQPVALRGAEREAAQRRGAAGSPRRGAQRGAPLPAGALAAPASFTPPETRRKCEEGAGEPPPSSACPLDSPLPCLPAFFPPSSLALSPPAPLPCLFSPPCRLLLRASHFPCSRPLLGISSVHFSECWGLQRSPLPAQLPPASSLRQIGFLCAP